MLTDLLFVVACTIPPRFSAKPTRPHMDAAVNCVRYTQVHVSHHRLTAEDISGVCHGGGGFGTSTHAQTSKKLGDAGVLSGETGFRLVGCLRANKRSIARTSAGSRKPWHVPRPDLSARISALQGPFCLSAAGRVGCHRSPSFYPFFAARM